ncbi:hypothetical protein [Paenibacillus radicis (ex Gao et al. 2016)]|uniref:Uncharacterized protein n=1 Tax=Paenibacillus radicis (ex Gao et al. 2016) TaxID=1737354 RepID=A0A917LUK8_9BACL|nr:hypothetical protein [Paenibacillus radicis (ex Gao et al. 2016)]GGG56270.1 hypothetical protein GCM10010918_06520 [Paenibacillus radicis (ex Gao et al. 2016)]
MKLIEFLLNNIYFVVIIGGVLFSIFRKAGGSARNGNPAMPTFGGGRGGDPARKTEEYEEEEQPQWMDGRYASPPEPEPQPEPPKPVIIRQQERAEDARAGAQRPRSPFNSSTPLTGGGTSQRPAAASLSALQETDELKKAIIWSEILGPPRSKRPFGK